MLACPPPEGLGPTMLACPPPGPTMLACPPPEGLGPTMLACPPPTLLVCLPPVRSTHDANLSAS